MYGKDLQDTIICKRDEPLPSHPRQLEAIIVTASVAGGMLLAFLNLFRWTIFVSMSLCNTREQYYI